MPAKPLNAAVIMTNNPSTSMSQAELTELVQAAISVNGDGAVINLPQGTIEMTGPFVDSTGDPIFKQIRGGGLRGHSQGTTFKWNGPQNVPMFTIDRCQGVILEGFRIVTDTSAALLEAIRIQQGAVDNGTGRVPDQTSSLCTVRDVQIVGAAEIGTGVRVYLHNYEEGGDDKNDHHRFENLHIDGCAYAGLVLEGRNAKALHLDHVVISGTADGTEHTKYGVLTVANMCPMSMDTPDELGDPAKNDGEPAFDRGASFTAIGGMMSGCTVANLYLGDRNDELVIQGVYSEKSARWLVVPDYGTGASSAFPVKLDGCRYTVNSNTADDGEIIQFLADGPLILTSCRFGQQAGDGADAALLIRYMPRVRPGTFIMEGCAISNANDGNVFVGEAPSNPDYKVTNRGWRNSELARLGPGVVIPTAGPGAWKFPVTPAQWGEVDGTGTAPYPDSSWLTNVSAIAAWAALTAYPVGVRVTNGANLYEAVTAGTSAASGGPTGTGAGITDGTVVWDFVATGTGLVDDVIGAVPLIADGTLDYAQPLTGFSAGIRLNGLGEELSPNVTAFNPAIDSVAWKIDAQITSSGGNAPLISMGNSNQGTGGGAVKVRITAAGLAELFVDGSVRATGTVDYRSSDVHRFVFVLDRQQAAGCPRTVAYLFTDREMLSADVTGAAITNHANKGIGAGSASLTPPTCVVLDPAVWSGQDKIDTILTSAWRAAMNVDATAIGGSLDSGDVDRMQLSWVDENRIRVEAGLCRSSDGSMTIALPAAVRVGATSIASTDVNTTTNLVTLTGHQFVPGDGPVRLASSGTLPAGLSAGTDYWIVYGSANTIGFATTYASAVAAPPTLIDLTSTGSGTHRINGPKCVDDGELAAQAHHAVWALASSTNAVNPTVVLSTSATAPTYPTGYDRRRRVGWVRTNNAVLIAFSQRGNGRTRRIDYDAPHNGSPLQALLIGTASTFTDVPLSGFVPPGCDFVHLLCGFETSAANAFSLRPNGATASDGPQTFSVGAAASEALFTADLPTDTSQVIEYLVTNSTTDALSIWVLGYDDEL